MAHRFGKDFLAKSKNIGRMLAKFKNLLLSKLFKFLGRRYFSQQTAFCLCTIESRRNAFKDYAPADLDLLVNVLVIAEDRRFFFHCGMDVHGVARAIVAYFTRRKIQGASTITQQLVRVAISDYQRSFRRKLQEICIAVELDSVMAKRDQAVLYLEIGYYGWRMNGLLQAKDRLGIPTPCSESQAIEIVARLKYPQPENPSNLQVEKIQRRVNHISKLLSDYRHDK